MKVIKEEPKKKEEVVEAKLDVETPVVEQEEVETPSVEDSIPLISFSLNYPQNGKTYPVMRKKHKGMKQMFLPETQLINSVVIKLYNQLVKQFNTMPQAVQSGFISELNRLINYIRKQQLEAEATAKLQAESKLEPIPQDDNSTKIEEGESISSSADISPTSDTLK